MSPSSQAVPLSSHSLEPSVLLLSVLALAGLGTGVLFAGSVLAAWQRRDTRYVLVTLAVGALLVRSVVGLGTLYGRVPMEIHHLVAHTLDFTIAVLVLYAVYRSRPVADTGEFQPGD